jgi:hypothetical protein
MNRRRWLPPRYIRWSCDEKKKKKKNDDDDDDE